MSWPLLTSKSIFPNWGVLKTISVEFKCSSREWFKIHLYLHLTVSPLICMKIKPKYPWYCHLTMTISLRATVRAVVIRWLSWNCEFPSNHFFKNEFQSMYFHIFRYCCNKPDIYKFWGDEHHLMPNHLLWTKIWQSLCE